MPSLPTTAVVSWKDAAQRYVINTQDYNPAYHILWEEREAFPGMRHKQDTVSRQEPAASPAPPMRRGRTPRPPRIFEAFAPSPFMPKGESPFLEMIEDDEDEEKTPA